MRVGYFVHDLNDPAVAKRLEMLRRGGIKPVVAGFWRGNTPPETIAGAQTLPLQRTYDARLGHRALMTLKAGAGSRALAQTMGPVDLFMARNLEMLAIAKAAARRSRVPVVYEVLDIHRLLLAKNATGSLLRWLEHRLMRGVTLLITSSPAFVREYFEPVHRVQQRVPTLLVENKPLASPPVQTGEHTAMRDGPPWRIGWFGMIRCKRSFAILSSLAKRRPDLVRIVIRGRPAQSEFGDFAALVAQSPGVEFAGPYVPEELPCLYGGIHFSWAIDYFEEGANSEWLLPNRLYEGGAHNAIPMALRRTETGHWLRDKDLGVLMDDPTKELESFLERLSSEKYAVLRHAAAAAPRNIFVADDADCARLAAALASAANVQNRMSAETMSCGVT